MTRNWGFLYYDNSSRNDEISFVRRIRLSSFYSCAVRIAEIVCTWSPFIAHNGAFWTWQVEQKSVVSFRKQFRPQMSCVKLLLWSPDIANRALSVACVSIKLQTVECTSSALDFEWSKWRSQSHVNAKVIETETLRCNIHTYASVRLHLPSPWRKSQCNTRVEPNRVISRYRYILISHVYIIRTTAASSFCRENLVSICFSVSILTHSYFLWIEHEVRGQTNESLQEDQF